MRVAGHIHEQVAEYAVYEPWRTASALLLVQCPKCQLHFIHSIGARFIHSRRLARRADEHSGKQVRQRRMIQPISNQTFQQVGPPEKRTVRGSRSADHNVISATGSGMPAVE